MEQRLYDAAVAGDATSLAQLIEEDPLLLDKANLNSQDNNPLHIAAIFGHVEFVKAVLPHNSDMCFVPDRFGRNPLHLAAIKGRLDVLKEIIRARPQAAREKTTGGDTVLHLCIKNNQLETLKILVKTMKDHEFVNVKNGEEMTVLHLAICNEQNETIEYLLRNTKVDVNALNANGNTALDLFQGDTNSKIVRYLKAAGAKKGKKIAPQEVEWLTKKREALMIVVTLIATMAFQAGATPPGGVWQEDSEDPNDPKPHMAGEAVMAKKDAKYYRYFVRANTVAYVSSLSIILLLISGLPFKRNKFFTWALTVIMWMTVTSAALTYGISILMVTPVRDMDQANKVLVTAVTVWSGVLALLLMGNTIRLLNRWLKYHGIDLLRKIKHWYWAPPERTNDKHESSQMTSV